MTQKQAIDFLLKNPYKLGHILGFGLLREDLHNKWIKDMVKGKADLTIQAHRGSYKTTCVALALTILIILYPNKKILFMRKTDGDVKEIVSQVKKMLQSSAVRYFISIIYHCDLKLLVATQTQITTNLCTDPRGTEQLTAQGIGGSLTGKHFDIIFTDDIVNKEDRVSKAERERTKLVYQELQNIKNRGGRIVNSGTPWHKEDAFTLMPNIEKHDCYSTGLITEEELQALKSSMSASLFAANYELKHIADENLLFGNPKFADDVSLIEQGIAHIDAAYGGEDGTAFSIMRKVVIEHKIEHEATDTTLPWTEIKHEVKYYLFGKLWQRHVDDVIDEAIKYRKMFSAGKIYNEDNGDKGYLGKDLKRKGERVVVYHENMNKYEKIATYLKAIWEDLYFIAGTDKEYIEQICDYSEDAEHDDAPDSAACLARLLWKKSVESSSYKPQFLG